MQRKPALADLVNLAALSALAALVLLASSCSMLRDGALDDDDDDDDDSAVGSDDDDTGDDDDDTGDDDDDTGDDDDDDSASDDDDSAGDDDDSAGGDPGEAFVGVTYCLDWNTVDLVEPAGFGAILLTFTADYPLLLNPTGVAPAVNEIIMIGGSAQPATCSQDLSLPTVNPTAEQAGTYVAPHFSVGPVDISMPTASIALEVYEFVIEGDFSSDASQIVDAILRGSVDITSYAGSLCTGSPNPCYPCPSGGGQCIDFRGENAVWNDNGEGPMTPVP